MQYIQTQTPDELFLRGLLFETVQKNKIIIHIHGMSSDLYTGDYLNYMHKTYISAGIAFLTVELRGTHLVTSFKTNKGFKIIGGAYEMFEDCIFDIQAWIQKAFNLVWLQGASLAPSKLVYYLSETKNHKVSGLILLSPADMFGLINDPIGQKEHEICIQKAKKFIKQNRGDQLLPCLLWGQKRLSASTYINYFGDFSNARIFNYKNLHADGWKHVEKIDVPVIAFTGTKDEGITPVIDVYKAMHILKSKLQSSPRKETTVIKGANHNFDGFGRMLTRKIISFVNDIELKYYQ